MAQGPSPLLGYNTNVRHKGKLYHIQTEDSGVQHPHIITHLFADGGRIVASKKTSYSEHVGVEDLKTVVKKMMQDQHKAMFIALRDGIYDEPEAATDVSQSLSLPPLGASPSSVAAPSSVPSAIPATPAAEIPRVDVDALERAAARLAGTPQAAPGAPVTGRYQPTQPAAASPVKVKSKPPESIFGSDLLSEKSLDEVILSYLATDLDETEG